MRERFIVPEDVSSWDMSTLPTPKANFATSLRPDLAFQGVGTSTQPATAVLVAID